MDNLPEKKLDYIQLYSVSACLQEFKGIDSPIKAFNSESDSLSSIKKLGSEKICMALLRVWIMSLNDFVNVSRKMTPGQIIEICIYIYDEYYFLKMSDIYLIITRIKKGYYGQLFESIDGMKVLSFFEKYSNERANAVFNQQFREHDKLKYSETKQLGENKINKNK